MNIARADELGTGNLACFAYIFLFDVIARSDAK